jgi:O-methyltransferase
MPGTLHTIYDWKPDIDEMERRRVDRHPGLGREPFRSLYEKHKGMSMLAVPAFYNIYSTLEHIARNGIPGDLVECGCFLGGSTAFIWEACVHLGIDDRRLFVFDTFDGFPPGETDAFRGRTFGPEDFIPDGTNFRAAFDEYTRDVIPADRVRVVPGMVEQTLPPIEFGELAFVRLDTDFYASTRAELETLYPRLVAGGVLIIDDYGSFDGARRATDEYFEANRPAPALLRIDHGTHCGIKVHAGSR